MFCVLCFGVLRLMKQLVRRRDCQGWLGRYAQDGRYLRIPGYPPREGESSKYGRSIRQV